MSLRQRLETFHLIAPPAGWPAGSILVSWGDAQPNSRVAIYSALLSAPASITFRFTNTNGTPISGPIAITGALVLEQNANLDPWFLTEPGQGVILADGGPLFGDIYYLIVPGN